MGHARPGLSLYTRKARRPRGLENALFNCLDLLKPFPAEQMTAYEVSQLINNGKIHSPECVKPI
jgi:hypothetical protein